jgi:hypothetical protein
MASRSDRRVDAYISELMRGPLGDFASARNEAARALRTERQPELAKRVAALRKPTLVLWALNHAAEAGSADLDEVRAAGDRLRQAQQDVVDGEPGAAERLSHAVREQRRAIDAVSRRIGMVLTAAGHAASDETLRRVSDGLRNASIADAGTWSALREGRLQAEPDAASFPMLDAKGSRRVARTADTREAEARQKRLAAAQAGVRRAEEALAAAQEQESAARQRREEADRALHEARRALTVVQDDDQRNGSR